MSLGRRLLAGLGRVEARLPGPEAPRCPPLFVVGPPRSGTTLIYQALSRGLWVAAPTNLMLAAELAEAPHVYRLAARVLVRGAADFESDHGRTRGWGSPHEAGPLWNRLFDGAALRPGGAAALRRVVARIEAAFGAPFVNKNVMHTPRIAALVEALPTARFLEVRRDPEATARSIVRARERAGADGWWSVRPSNAEALDGLDEWAQARGQVAGVQADLAAARAAVGADRFFTLDYEAFCAAPRPALGELAAWWGARTRLDALPERFEASGGSST